VDRRTFAAATLGLLAAPLAAGAQKGAVPRIGILDGGSLASRDSLWGAFRQGMSELGYVEGRSVIFEARWADGKNDRLPALAAELVRLEVDAIVTATNTAAQVAHQVTATIPIVMTTGDENLVTSLARPGGNVTGLTSLTVELSAKRLELARELVRGASRFAILVHRVDPVLGGSSGERRRRPKRLGSASMSSPSRARQSSTGRSRRSRGIVPRPSS
jgi:putative ABC transport system substrate-binding protein